MAGIPKSLGAVTGYRKGIRTVGTPSVSGPSEPSKAAPSVEYSENKLGKAKVVTDGKTEVTTDYSGKDDVARGVRQAYYFQHGVFPPCINTSCKSYGQPHPNCLCYGNHSEAGTFYAKGGEVCSENMSHNEKCEHYAEGGQVEENHKFHNSPVDALDHAAVHHGLLGLLTKLGHSKSEDPHKHLNDYIQSSKRGHKTVKKHVDGLLSNDRVPHDKDSHAQLKAHLQDLRENPDKMLDIGGDMGNVLPDHAMHLAAKAGAATSYLNSIKPNKTQEHPLDTLEPEDKIAEGHYDRHLDIAQNPMLILNHLKDGTLRPDDVTTLQSLYPELAKSISEKAYAQLVDAKQKGMDIPYKQKQSLSTLLGQPLDSSMTSLSMQAIINSAGPQQAQNQAKAKPKKASGVELNQINKIDAMDATALQDRQIDKSKR